MHDRGDGDDLGERGRAGPANQDTFFTFSQAVELPKTTLPAGTYFFQLMDSPAIATSSR